MGICQRQVVLSEMYEIDMMRIKKRIEEHRQDRFYDNLNRLIRDMLDFAEKERNESMRIQELNNKHVLELEAKEKMILDKINRNMPDLHFKGCPWCGEEPYLQVRLFRKYKNNKSWVKELDVDGSNEYRVELHTCEHLNHSGMLLNSYTYPNVPKKPLYPNPKSQWDTSWNDHQWEYAVKDYEKYLSDDYPYQCCRCHKKWRGYDIMDSILVDGKRYCRGDCSGIFEQPDNNGRRYAKMNIIRDIKNIDSMYDDSSLFYTSLEKCVECHKVDMSEVYTKHLNDGRSQGADGLSGSISGDHWEIWEKGDGTSYFYNCLGYVFDVNEKEISTYKRLER